MNLKTSFGFLSDGRMMLQIGARWRIQNTQLLHQILTLVPGSWKCPPWARAWLRVRWEAELVQRWCGSCGLCGMCRHHVRGMWWWVWGHQCARGMEKEEQYHPFWLRWAQLDGGESPLGNNAPFLMRKVSVPEWEEHPPPHWVIHLLWTAARDCTEGRTTLKPNQYPCFIQQLSI